MEGCRTSPIHPAGSLLGRHLAVTSATLRTTLSTRESRLAALEAKNTLANMFSAPAASRPVSASERRLSAPFQPESRKWTW